MLRVSKHAMFMEIAKCLGKRSTCKRRQVGCVLVNEHFHIIGTGYNGVGKDLPHCIDSPCPGADYASGQGLDKCEAIHAEQNALMQCSDVKQIFAAYITCSPCVHCAKLFLNTGIKHLFYEDYYVGSNEALSLLGKAGVSVMSVKAWS